tara:strand:- start:575 stop:1108 length:534 start_codon:yes stop_codon:yes gene_type:complete
MRALSKKDRYKNKRIKKEEKAIIVINDGVCSIESGADVLGIELKFKGNAKITPELPEGWIMQGNTKKILMIGLNGVSIRNQILFSYVGYMDIINVIVSNDKGKQLSEVIKTDYAQWGDQTFDFSIDTTIWKDHKDKKRFGSVKRTSYKLPDYGLPKLDKKKKFTRKKRETSRSSGGY